MHDPETRNKVVGINSSFAKYAVPTRNKEGYKVWPKEKRRQIIENSILKFVFVIIIANVRNFKVLTDHCNLYQYEYIFLKDWLAQRKGCRIEIEKMEKGELN